MHSPPAGSENSNRAVWLGCLFFAAVAAALCGWIALTRTYFNTGTESDTLGRFIGEAAAVMRGGPLAVDIHLPGYAIALAAAQSLVQDWLTSGLIISWISAVVALLVTWRLFTLIGNTWVALGAVGALAASSLFIAFGAQATSDMLFLALFMAALLAGVEAMRSGRAMVWVVAGVLAGVAFLVRTNGVVLMALVFAPLFAATAGARARGAAAFLAGVFGPLAAWGAFAAVSGSPFMPTETHTNIATTYFAQKDGTGCMNEKRVAMGREFSSSVEVISAGPLTILKKYVRDLAAMPLRMLRTVTWPPIALLGAVPLLFWITRLRSPSALVVFGIGLCMALLMNLKDFEGRYYLYAAAFLGGGLGFALSWLLDRRKVSERGRAGVLLAFCGLLAAGTVFATINGQRRAEPKETAHEIEQAVEAARKVLPPDAVVVARKHFVPFYTERHLLWFPVAETASDLCASLDKVAPNTPVYVYIGSAERLCRPTFAAEVLNGTAPDWFSIVARGGTEKSPWALARVNRSSCRATGPPITAAGVAR